MTTATLKTSSGFGVFAYYSGAEAIETWGSWNPTTPPTEINKAPNFMYNEAVTWSTDKWVYSPVKYWPNGVDAANGGAYPSNTATEATANQKLSFFAYAPYVAASEVEYVNTNDYVGATSNDAPTGGAMFTGTGAPTAKTSGIVAISKNSATEDMRVKYILDAANTTNAVDLLWGLRGQNDYQQTNNTANNVATLGTAYNTDLTKQIVSEKVKFLFKHALARVGGNTSKTTSASGNQICGVKVKLDVDSNNGDEQSSFQSGAFTNTQTLVTINSVKIRDKYSYAYETNTSTTEVSDFLTDGWFDIMNGTWSNTAPVVSHTTGEHGATYSNEATAAAGNLNPAIAEPTSAPAASNVTASSTWTGLGDLEGVAITPKNLYKDNVDIPGILLIPETNGNTLYVTVDYTVRTADKKLANSFTEVRQVITNMVTLGGAAPNNLEPNKVYTILMHLGLTSVKFEAVVADWQTNEGGSYDENGVYTEGGEENKASVWLPSNVVKATMSTTAVAAAGNTTVNLTGLTGSTLTVVDKDNTVVTGTSGSLNITSGNATVQVACRANTGVTKRNGWIKLSDGYKTITINVTQDPVALAVSAGTISAGANEATITVNDPEGDYTSQTITVTATKDEAPIELSTVTPSFESSKTKVTVALPAAASSGTYVFTVKVADATGTTSAVVTP